MPLQSVSPRSALVINQAIENVAELTQGLDCTVETFGLADGADWQAKISSMSRTARIPLMYIIKANCSGISI